MLDTKWHEPKTIETYAVFLITDKKSWFKLYFIMGAYTMWGNGLFRNDKQIKSGLEYDVFPSLHKFSDSYVATIL